MPSYNSGMASSYHIAPNTEISLARLDQIEKDLVRALPVAQRRQAGFVGRLLGRSSTAAAEERRLELEASPGIPERVAVIVAHRLLNVSPREIARRLPEALLQGPPSKDDETRFMDLADAAQAVVRQHLERPIPAVPVDEMEAMRVHAVVEAIDDEDGGTLSEGLATYLNASLEGRSQSGALVHEDALLIEVDNVILGDVGDDGSMPYCMDVIVDGHPLATLASTGHGDLEPLAWFGGHGPEDLEDVRSHVALCGEPRIDEDGERPDSLEEVLLDRVSVLLARRAYLDALSDAVLFCDPDASVPEGYVIKVAPIDPQLGREVTWGVVIEAFPEALILDMMDEDDGFTLWLAYSST